MSNNGLNDFKNSKEVPTNVIVDNEDQKQKVITQMNQLRHHAGWKILVNDIKILINQTESDIFTVGSNEIEFSGKDLLVLLRDFMIQVVDHPENIIKKLMQEKDSEPDDDPYA